LNGFESEITDRVINLESHIRITGKDISNKDLNAVKSFLSSKEYEEISPFVINKSVLSTSYRDAVVRVKGIDSSILPSLFSQENSILKGRKSLSAPICDSPGILIGYRLADHLGVYIGDTLNVINPLKVGLAYSIPYVGKFVVSGIFNLDVFDYDDNMAFIELKEGQRVFELNGYYSGIDIKLKSYKSVNIIKEDLALNFGDRFKISTWEDLHKTLFNAMKLEKYGSFAALCFIILVAIFNLMSSLTMLVMEKIREIGMLQALGINQTHIKGIFLRMGMLTGSIGLVLGSVVALVVCLLQSSYKFISLPAVYIIPYLPVEVHTLDVILILVAGIFLVYVGTLYPVSKIRKLMPLEAIKYEK
jgi:lipoprotein-releasing system permease protein